MAETGLWEYNPDEEIIEKQGKCLETRPGVAYLSVRIRNPDII